MSSSRGSGIKRHRLVLLAIDFSSEGNEIVLSECVDAWGEFELLDEVYLVDLSVVDAASFSCVEPGQTETFLLEKILSDKIWSDITVISVRLAPLSRVDIRRVSQEESLQLAVERVFPDGAACKTSFFTMSWTNDEDFYAHSLPRSYSSNFLHDRGIYAGAELARAPFDEKSRHLSLVFTALIGSGGFSGQVNVPFQRLAEQDAGLKVGQIIRPVRAIARAASGGWFFRDALRRAMLNDDFYLPSNVLNAIPDSGSSIVIGSLVKETSDICKFNYQKLSNIEKPKSTISLLKGFLLLLKDLPKYLKTSARKVVLSELSDRVRPLADALQELYGQDSIIAIQGSSIIGDGRTSEVAKLLQIFGQRVSEGFDFLPENDPRVWQNFCKIVTGSLDGSDLPEGIRSLTKTGRIIFTNPQIVAPSRKSSIFELRPAERELLGVQNSRTFREPDALDRESQEMFRQICKKVKLEKTLRPETQNPDTASPGDPYSKGSLVSRISNSSRENPKKSEVIRDARTLLDEFEKWLPAAVESSEKTFIAKVAKNLEDAIEQARLDVKIEELKRFIQEQENLNNNRLKKKIASILAKSGVLGLSVATIFSVLKVFTFAVVPFLLIWLIVWVSGTAVGLGFRVFKEAIAARKRDLAGFSETNFNKLFEVSKNAMQEYVRLQVLYQNFQVWSRILREIIHSPFGQLEDRVSGRDEITRLPHPRQFSIAQVQPSDDQLQFLLNEIRRMVLIKGHLNSVLRGTLGYWREEYIKNSPDGLNLDPYNDLAQTWGQAIGKRLNGEHVFYPLQDFYQDIVHGDLREETAIALQAEIEQKFKGYEVRDVFSKITEVDPEHQALRNFSPSDYLFDYLENPATKNEQFSIDLFNTDTPNAIGLRQDNVDHSKDAMWNHELRTLGNFNLRTNKRFVMLTYLFTVGKQANLDDLKGFKTVQGDERPGDARSGIRT